MGAFKEENVLVGTEIDEVDVDVEVDVEVDVDIELDVAVVDLGLVFALDSVFDCNNEVRDSVDEETDILSVATSGDEQAVDAGVVAVEAKVEAGAERDNFLRYFLALEGDGDGEADCEGEDNSEGDDEGDEDGEEEDEDEVGGLIFASNLIFFNLFSID